MASTDERYTWRFAKALALVVTGISAHVWIDGAQLDWIERAELALIDLRPPAPLEGAVTASATAQFAFSPQPPERIVAAARMMEFRAPVPIGTAGVAVPVRRPRRPVATPFAGDRARETLSHRVDAARASDGPDVLPTGGPPPLPAAAVPLGPRPAPLAGWTRDPAALAPVDVLESTPAAARRAAHVDAVAPSALPPAAEIVATRAVAVVNAPREEESILQVIRSYEMAVGRKDPLAAKAVWPSLDDRALARAFNDLEAHSLALEGCGVTVTTAGARARCHGVASSLPKVGRRRAITASHEWTFDLSKSGGGWHIESAAVR